MVVYGKDKVKYDLDREVRSVGSGKDYHVAGREETLVARIYERGARTRAREEEVRQSLEGLGTMPESPVDILYKNSRFAGFLYYDYSLETTTEIPQEEPQDTYEKKSSKNFAVPPALIIGAEVVILSLMVRFLLYPYILKLHSDWMLKLSVGGITQIVAGLIILGVAYSKWLTNAENAILIGLGAAAAYVTGAVGITAVLIMLVRVVTTAVEIVMYILPGVIGIIVVIAIIKSMFSK